METIYLITKKCYEVNIPSYLQNTEEIPLYGVYTLEAAKKELEMLRKDEEERFENIINSVCRFEFDYKVITIYGKRKAAH